MKALLKRLLRNDRGSIALKFALIVPGVALLSVGAIDLNSVHSAQNRLQGIADAAALAGASDLALATDGRPALSRADAYYRAELAEWSNPPTIKPIFELVTRGGQRALKVRLEAQRPSFFANMLPPGGWKFNSEAIASPMGLTPLCVLITGQTGTNLLTLTETGRVTAPSCMVHSNRDIDVQGGMISAAAVQAVTSARGYISPVPNTGAAVIPDPFVGLKLDYGKTLVCTAEEILLNRVRVIAGVHVIPPGRHCGGIDAAGSARVILLPGEHFFLGGHLITAGQATLEGDDVVLFFDDGSRFDFRGMSVVNLRGRKTGEYAGLVMGSTRANKQDFLISADNVRTLLGVIYVPSARLIVEGRRPVAQDSAWTVIVAQSMFMRGTPSLFINANYNGSSVPVPDGVGPGANRPRLVE